MVPPWLVNPIESTAAAGTFEAHCTLTGGGQVRVRQTLPPANAGPAKKLNAASKLAPVAPRRHAFRVASAAGFGWWSLRPLSAKVRIRRLSRHRVSRGDLTAFIQI